MRTDDFNGPVSEDHENRPDVLAADRDAELGDGEGGFNEFDAPLPGERGGNSLSDLWNKNPIVKIAALGVGLLAVVAALIMFGGESQQGPESQVGSAINQSEAPGQETSEAYREAVNEVNQQRLEQAMKTGESTMPIPVAQEQGTPAVGVNEEPPVNLEDPLEGWRASNQGTAPEPTLDPNSLELQGGNSINNVNGTNAQGQPLGPNGQPIQQGPMGPDPAAVDALAQAMGAQMAGILDKHKITGPQVMQVTAADYFTSKTDDAGGGGGDGTDVPEIREILIPAGTIVYAQTLTEANTDAPGPVLARLSSGPLAGSRILGTFQDTEKYLTLQFNTVIINGVSQATNAVALDPKTTLPAVATEIDRRYWRRVLLPAAARFIEGMGDAIAQREQTVVVTGETSVSSQPDLDTTQELAAGLAEGTSELADELDREGDSTKVMIKVHAGTPIGILFLDPVLKDDAQ